jgi:N-acetylglutamate synthase-like GNAT family acetyltransferase
MAVDADGVVIGCVQLKPHRDGSIELASLLVVEGWRGRGVARTLIEAAVAAHDGTLYLMCRPELESLYRKFGFIPLPKEEMPPYFRRITRLVKVIRGLFKPMEGPLIMRREIE